VTTGNPGFYARFARRMTILNTPARVPAIVFKSREAFVRMIPIYGGEDRR
jgi:hypothetical protein